MRHGLDISMLVHRFWIDGRSAALTAVKPWRLARAARQASLAGAIVAAVLALAVECSALLVVIIARFELDRETVAARLLDAAVRFQNVLPFVTAALSFMMIPAIIGLVLLTRRATTPVLNVFVLTPVCFVLVVPAWAVVALVLDGGSTGHNVMTPCIWIPLMVIIAVVLQVCALTALDAVAVQRAMHCPQCHYPLKGLTTPRCPECGCRFGAARP